MSRTIFFEVKFSSNEEIYSGMLLETLFNSGWSPTINGKINHLPIDDNEMYNWTEKKITISELYEIIQIKEQAHEVIGVSLYWNNTNLG